MEACHDKSHWAFPFGHCVVSLRTHTSDDFMAKSGDPNRLRHWRVAPLPQFVYGCPTATATVATTSRTVNPFGSAFALTDLFA